MKTLICKCPHCTTFLRIGIPEKKDPINGLQIDCKGRIEVSEFEVGNKLTVEEK